MTTWKEILAEEMEKDYYQQLQAFVQKNIKNLFLCLLCLKNIIVAG